MYSIKISLKIKQRKYKSVENIFVIRCLGWFLALYARFDGQVIPAGGMANDHIVNAIIGLYRYVLGRIYVSLGVKSL